LGEIIVRQNALWAFLPFKLPTTRSGKQLIHLRLGTDCPNIRSERSEQANVFHLPMENIRQFAAFAANIRAVSTQPKMPTMRSEHFFRLKIARARCGLSKMPRTRSDVIIFLPERVLVIFFAQ